MRFWYMRLPKRQNAFILAAVALSFYGLATLRHKMTQRLSQPSFGDSGRAQLEPITRHEDELYFGPNDGSMHVKGVVKGDGLWARTSILTHAPGNTIFERLYIYNGTIFIISDDPASVPDLRLITSNGEKLASDTKPTEKDIRVIAPLYSKTIFPVRPIRLPGTTFLMTESHEFMHHYYHFVGEILVSLWRTYTTLDPHISIEGHTSLAAPRRLIFTHSNADAWRDRAGMNAFIARAAFKTAEMLYSRDWSDLADTRQAFVLDRVVLFDRGAAHRGPHCGQVLKALAEAASLPQVQNWWRPIQSSVFQFVGASTKEAVPRLPRSRRVVTYVSRQLSGRRLKDVEHERLVAALEALRDELGFELNIAQLELMDRDEQIRLSARTNILMGVHGNGLTAMLWMDPSSIAVVFEFFMPGAFIRDYEFAAKTLGLEYHGFWNDTHFTHPGFNIKWHDDVHGPNYVIDAPTVSTLIREILTSK